MMFCSTNFLRHQYDYPYILNGYLVLWQEIQLSIIIVLQETCMYRHKYENFFIITSMCLNPRNMDETSVFIYFKFNNIQLNSESSSTSEENFAIGVARYIDTVKDTHNLLQCGSSLVSIQLCLYQSSTTCVTFSSYLPSIQSLCTSLKILQSHRCFTKELK